MIVIHYRTHPDAADANQALVEQVFAQLDAEQPDGVRYATLRLGDRFVHLVLADDPGLPGRLSAFAAFQEGLADRLVDPPERSAATVVGSYRLLTPRWSTTAG
jgi:hypothetical protein